MNASTAVTDRNTQRELPPQTAKELLEREETLALQGIAEALQRAAHGLAESADLGPRIRSHPWLATGLAAYAGFASGPVLLRLSTRLLGVRASGGARAHGRGPSVLPGLALAALRVVRARR